jgi:hypothetical protein
LNLMEEDNHVILDKYAEMDIPFTSMQSSVEDILKVASFNETIINSDYIYENLVLLADTSGIFLDEVLLTIFLNSGEDGFRCRRVPVYLRRAYHLPR